MPRRKKRCRPKGATKSPRTPKEVQERAQSKRRRLSAKRLEKLRLQQENLMPRQGHNYARRKDCLRLILLLLVTSYIEHAGNTACVDGPYETLYGEAYQSVMKQVLCSRRFPEKLWNRYNCGTTGEIESPQKRGRKRAAPERVYEGSQFAPDDVADLEHWVFELNSEEEGCTLKKLRKRFLMEKTSKCVHM